MYFCLQARVLVVALAVSSVSIVGCGSGSNSGGGIQSSPSYILSAEPSTLSIYPGGTGTLTILGQPENGFSGTVSVSFGGLPAGVTASPSTFTFSGAGTQQVQFSAAATAAAGNATVTANISGATGSPSLQLQFTITGPPSISLALQPTSLSLIPGVQQSAQLSVNATNGFNQLISGTLTGLPSGITVSSPTFSVFPGGTATFYFTAAAGASSGTLTFNASSGSLSATAQMPISINTMPDFQLTTGTNNVLVISQGASESFSISAVGYNGFSQPISVSFAGVPTGVAFSPASFTLQPGGASQTVTMNTTFSAAPTSTTFAITGSAGGITHQLQVSLNINAAVLNLSLQPGTLTVPAGSTNSFELQLLNEVIGTPTGNISLRISGAPSGVSISPTSYTSPPQGVGFNVYVTAGNGAAGGTLIVTATYGPAQATASMPIVIGKAEGFTPVAATTTDQLLRTDTLTPYYGFPPPNYTVYHAATQRFFSTEPYLNHLNVVDATSRTLTTALTIPGAFGLDQAPDGSVLFVGTMVGDLYVVDPVHLTIVKRYASSTISQYGFPANAVYALADGKLILESYFLVPGFSWVDGNGPIALWDPATNDITVFGQSDITGYGYNGSAPTVPSCFNRVENVMLTNNRTRVLLAPVLSSEGSSELCSLDPETDTWNLSGQISGGSGSALNTLAVTADGNTLFAYDGFNIYSLDPATFTVKTSFAASAPQTASYAPISVLLVSPDNSSIFLTDANGSDVFDVYNLATGKLTGWIPQLSMASPGSYSPVQPMYQAITPSGLAAGVMAGGGIGLLDTTAVHPLPIGSRFTQTQLAVPYGPVVGGTDTSWLPNVAGVSPPPLGSIYFGPNAATDINNNGFTGFLEAVTPPGTAGPVDVRTFTTDGSSQFIPDGFSYGPWVLEVPTSYSTADGGGIGDLFGYGFGPQLYTGGALFVKPPSDLAVTIGGASATVNEFGPNPYGSTYFTAAVFPSNVLQYTVPPGTAGTSANINVSNASGSTTATQSMNFLPALQRYPVSGQLADGVYDSTRDVYYFSDANQIRVFSLTQKEWLPSIPIPAPQGAYGPQRLAGLAMSPNGGNLAVADAGAIAIYVVNLNNANSISSYPFASQFQPLTEVPTALAIANTGIVYVATSDLSGDGGCGFLLGLNPSSGTFSNVGPSSQNNCLPTEGGTVGTSLASSPDGSRIFFDDSGIVGFIDTASGQVSIAGVSGTDLGQGGYEIEVNSAQARLFADGFFTDTNLNAVGLEVLNIAESVDAQYVYGGAFSVDGNLFFQPGTQAIDVFDAVTGAFRTRVALPLPLSPNFRALVPNTKDNRIIAITGSAGDGIAVIDLSSLPEPPPVTWLSAVAAPAVTRNPQANNTAIQKKLENPVPVVHRPARPLLHGLAQLRK